MEILNRLKEIAKHVPIILEPSLGVHRAAVYQLGLPDRNSPSLFKHCGFLPAHTQMAFGITYYVSELLLDHEMVHIHDHTSSLIPFIHTLKNLNQKNILSEESAASIRSFVMEQRAYNNSLERLRQQVIISPAREILSYSEESSGNEFREIVPVSLSEEYDREYQLAANAFEEEYIPGLKKALATIINPEIHLQLKEQIRMLMLSGPLKLNLQ